MKNTFDSIDQVNNLREIQALNGGAVVVKPGEETPLGWASADG